MDNIENTNNTENDVDNSSDSNPIENKKFDIKIYVGSTAIYEDNNEDNNQNTNEKKLSFIKETISKALQIDNLNFLLGAGCSSYRVTNKDNDIEELGISTMAGLFCDFIKQDNLILVGLNKDILLKNFNTNLENLLEYLISLNVIVNKLDNSNISILKIRDDFEKKNVEKAINRIKNFIVKSILNKRDSKEVIELYKLFYQKIINKNRKNPINIFTTNYDIYNEMALDKLNFLYNNGFSGTVERKFNPMLYKYMFVENMNLNKDVWEPVSYFFNLIKLHGSITWEADDNLVEIHEKNNFYNFDEEFKDDNDKKVMIYPSPLKDRSTLMTPYSDLFRFLENSLYLNNSTLIVMGYSFGDEHINRVIFNALANPTFRLIIFGNSENIKRLIKRNDKRITIIHSKILNEEKNTQKNAPCESSKKTEYEHIHYFKYIVNNILPSVNDDILEKETIEKIIKKLLKEQTNKGNI